MYVPNKIVLSPLGKRAHRALKTWGWNWTPTKGKAVVAAQEKAKKEAAKHSKKSRGKTGGVIVMWGWVKGQLKGEMGILLINL